MTTWDAGYIGSVKQSHKVTRSQGHKVTKCDVVTSDLVTDKNEVKMNWFKRTFRTGNCRRGKREEGRETKSSLIPHPSSFVLQLLSLPLPRLRRAVSFEGRYSAKRAGEFFRRSSTEGGAKGGLRSESRSRRSFHSAGIPIE